MSRKLNDLDPEFSEVAKKLLVKVGNCGYTMRPFYTRRTVFEQAKLWRQSRGSAEIGRALSTLARMHAPFLEGVLRDVGPQYGRWATNALPGLSWHNWGRALDCFLYIDGSANWESSHAGYRVYADAANELGLVPGYYWKSRDSVHVQLTSGRVLESKTWAEIDGAMQQLCGGLELCRYD